MKACHEILTFSKLLSMRKRRAPFMPGMPHASVLRVGSSPTPPPCASFAKRARPSLQAYNPTMEHPNLVVVQSYGSRPEADLAKGALEDAGIPAMVQADTAGGMREHLAWSGAGFKILVREEDATVARDVLTPPAGADESPDADFQSDPDTWPPSRWFT
jgi:hypothetical protein